MFQQMQAMAQKQVNIDEIYLNFEYVFVLRNPHILQSIYTNNNLEENIKLINYFAYIFYNNFSLL